MLGGCWALGSGSVVGQVARPDVTVSGCVGWEVGVVIRSGG